MVPGSWVPLYQWTPPHCHTHTPWQNLGMLPALAPVSPAESWFPGVSFALFPATPSAHHQ